MKSIIDFVQSKGKKSGKRLKIAKEIKSRVPLLEIEVDKDDAAFVAEDSDIGADTDSDVYVNSLNGERENLLRAQFRRQRAPTSKRKRDNDVADNTASRRPLKKRKKLNDY